MLDRLDIVVMHSQLSMDSAAMTRQWCAPWPTVTPTCWATAPAG